MKTLLWTIALAIFAPLLAAPATAQERPPQIGGNPVILSPEEALAQGAPPSIADNAYRVSRIDLSLNQDERGQWNPGASDSWRFRGTGGDVLLELFPDEVLWIKGTNVEDAESASSWVGEVLLPEPGVAVITRAEDGVYGTLDVGNRRYALVSATGDTQQVFAKQVDSRGIGICLTGGEHGDREHHRTHQHLSKAPTWASKPVAMEKSGGGSTSLDILFLYSAGAATYMGSSTSAFINNLVASLNTAFSASGVTGSARAVYYGLQTGVSTMTHLSSFRTAHDGMQTGVSPFTGLATLRNSYSADMVVLLVDRGPNSEICGLAGDYTGIPLYQPDLAGSSDGKAYAIVSANCADDDRTFHHEVGHVVGGWHDEPFEEWCWIDGNEPCDSSELPHACGIGNGSCGYTDLANEFRTIMGSNAQAGFDCTDNGGCPRLLRFSDWDQTTWANGGWRPLGQVQGARLGHENFVATLNGESGRTATIPWVANYRVPTGSAPGALSSLNVETCYSMHTITWGGATGTVGWYEVQSSPNTSYIPAQEIYRGPGSTLFHTSTTSIHTRARSCNAVGCSTWKNHLPSNPSTCL